jgi:hypothetical protein
MSLPTIFIFERHWDPIAKQATLDLLPCLAEQGYDTFCCEAPQDITVEKIVKGHSENVEFASSLLKQAEGFLKPLNITVNLEEMSFEPLSELMRTCVSSQRYYEVAEKIKGLKADKIQEKIFATAQKNYLSIQGVDINLDDFAQMMEPDATQRIYSLSERETVRISTMVENLSKLKKEKEGMVMVCGAMHAHNLVSKFKEACGEGELLYYFPYSSKRYDESLDDIKLLASNESLEGHTHLLSEKDIKPFTERVIQEIQIRSQHAYKKEIPEGTTNSKKLSECFGAHFKALLRAGHYVDAGLDIQNTPNLPTIQQKLQEKELTTRCVSFNGVDYLVIPEINTQKVAGKIRDL